MAVIGLSEHHFDLWFDYFRQLRFLQFACIGLHLRSHSSLPLDFDLVRSRDSGSVLDIDVFDDFQSSCVVGVAFRIGTMVRYSDFSGGFTFYRQRDH